MNAYVDKVTRAQRTGAAWNRGRIAVLAGQPWTDALVRELAAFGPGARRDDQVDALVNAHSLVALEEGTWRPVIRRETDPVLLRATRPEFRQSVGWARRSRGPHQW